MLVIVGISTAAAEECGVVVPQHLNALGSQVCAAAGTVRGCAGGLYVFGVWVLGAWL